MSFHKVNLTLDLRPTETWLILALFFVVAPASLLGLTIDMSSLTVYLLSVVFYGRLLEMLDLSRWPRRLLMVYYCVWPSVTLLTCQSGPEGMLAPLGVITVWLAVSMIKKPGWGKLGWLMFLVIDMAVYMVPLWSDNNFPGFKDAVLNVLRSCHESIVYVPQFEGASNVVGQLYHYLSIYSINFSMVYMSVAGWGAYFIYARWKNKPVDRYCMVMCGAMLLGCVMLYFASEAYQLKFIALQTMAVTLFVKTLDPHTYHVGHSLTCVVGKACGIANMWRYHPERLMIIVAAVLSVAIYLLWGHIEGSDEATYIGAGRRLVEEWSIDSFRPPVYSLICYIGYKEGFWVVFLIQLAVFLVSINSLWQILQRLKLRDTICRVILLFYVLSLQYELQTCELMTESLAISMTLIILDESWRVYEGRGWGRVVPLVLMMVMGLMTRPAMLSLVMAVIIAGLYGLVIGVRRGAVKLVVSGAVAVAVLMGYNHAVWEKYGVKSGSVVVAFNVLFSWEMINTGVYDHLVIPERLQPLAEEWYSGEGNDTELQPRHIQQAADKLLNDHGGEYVCGMAKLIINSMNANLMYYPPQTPIGFFLYNIHIPMWMGVMFVLGLMVYYVKRMRRRRYMSVAEVMIYMTVAVGGATMLTLAQADYARLFSPYMIPIVILVGMCYNRYLQNES
ncbi:MAG: hypothetical protein J6C44_08325 [Muribaculaceae bacterium]|nr:hypothetical protein [Muribaculaceae bacterium]